MAKFEIKKRKNGEYLFYLKSGNGHIILTGEGHTSLAGARSGIEAVRRASGSKSAFELTKARNGRPYFNVKAHPGDQIVGVSQLYASPSGRSKGIAAVKKNAPKAEILDLTGGR